MFPIQISAIYKTPDYHKPPPEDQLAENKDYPNLNSTNYAITPIKRDLLMHQCWEALSLNKDNQCVIATNKYNCREWTGSIWGFETIENVSVRKPAFKWNCTSNVSAVEYVSRDILAAAFHNGKVEIWSLCSAKRNSTNPYCPFMIGSKQEHDAPVNCLEVARANRTKVLTGGRNGLLKVWDMEAADLVSVNTFARAHFDQISGVSTSHRDEHIFATCSYDRSVLLWDDRLARPAQGIYEKHSCDFTAISYAERDQNAGEHLLFIGDRAGNVHSVDIRLPTRLVNTTKMFDSPVRKIIPKADKLAILSNSNIASIYRHLSDVYEMERLYENSEAQHFIRDGAWLNSDELLTVGYDAKLRKHKLP